MTEELKEHLIQFGDTIACRGGVKLEVCVRFKRGYIRDVYIYLLPESIRAWPGSSTIHHLVVPAGKRDTSIRFGSYGGLFEDHPWSEGGDWCKMHKCLSFRVFAPRGYDSFKLEPHLGYEISIEWWR